MTSRLQHIVIVFAAALLDLSQSQSITNGQTTAYAGADYITGTTPTGVTIQFQPGAQLNAGGQLSFTASTAIFAADGALTASDYAFQDSGGSPVFSSVAISGSGTIVTFTLQTGNVITGVTTAVTLKKLTSLPSPQTITFDVAATANTGQTGINGFLIISAPTITLTSPDLGVATQPVSLQAVWTSPVAVANTQTITLTANKALFNAGVTTGFTAAGTAVSVGGATFTYSTSTTAVTLTMSGGSVSVGQTLDISIPQAALALLPSTGVVTLTIVENSATVANAATGFGTIILASAVAGDPITFYNGTKSKFWIPMQPRFVPLLQTPEVHLLASALQGPEEDLQWFDRFLVTLPDGARVLEVGVRRQHLELTSNRSTRQRSFRQGGFQQLEVILGNDTRPLDVFKQGSFTVSGGSVTLAIAARHSYPPRFHGTPRTEYVHVQTESISFVLYGSHAGQEFPDNFTAQAKYVHMDLYCIEMVGEESYAGVLPEIWGIQPMSEEVRTMLLPPSQRRKEAACSETASRVTSCDADRRE